MGRLNRHLAANSDSTSKCPICDATTGSPRKIFPAGELGTSLPSEPFNPDYIASLTQTQNMQQELSTCQDEAENLAYQLEHLTIHRDDASERLQGLLDELNRKTQTKNSLEEHVATLKSCRNELNAIRRDLERKARGLGGQV